MLSGELIRVSLMAMIFPSTGESISMDFAPTVQAPALFALGHLGTHLWEFHGIDPSHEFLGKIVNPDSDDIAALRYCPTMSLVVKYLPLR